MPITFTVTCDTEAELARFLENLRLEKEAGLAKSKGSATATASVVEAPTRKSPAAAPKPKKAPGRKPAAGKAKAKAKAPVAKTAQPGKKTSKLAPIIQAAIDEVIKRGKPFRSQDVTDLVMKKNPDLKESSVTTGVIKRLGESKLKWKEVKESVGRPYKLYTP